MRAKRTLRTGARKTTLADVARASGFSPSTVSIVLNNAPLSRHVAAGTKARVREAAERLGYSPDIVARSLRRRRSGAIGVLAVDLADPFCTLVLQGIDRKLRGTSWHPIIMDAHNKPEQAERYFRMMPERRVEGVITVANWLLFDLSELEDLSDRHLPTVLVGHDGESPDMAGVVVDNQAGGYQAIEHLYNLGHREIAVVRGPRRLHDSKLRWKGIERFAREKQVRLDPALIRSLPDISDSASSFEKTRQMAGEFLQSGKPFTAVIAFDDISAFGAIRGLAEGGMRVPDNISVIGFDDIPAAALSTPSLSTIRQPLLEMGELAAEMVLQSLGAEGGEARGFVGASCQMPPELIVRGSTAEPGH